ncbi:DNA polymerase III subunit beta [Alicyclobacillus ferrooxydans]|uniref:Beta sliding clamp n=1 Tax=Alicyclobacillus ferrooxydans TaxID=471514 RepID=A0A0P9GWI9_9BACL|nr:DNA polymerase III subunit beta [Alicyclobacillus ferrooxydans]KPV45681.1 DNA polymerase III subunit beta [Alicyclobacillus ferrooxydans]
MKVTFRCEELVKVLRDIVRVVPSSTNRPVLKHVLIRANQADDRVDLYASSEDMSIRRTLYETIADPPVTIEASGACLLPAKELFEIVKKASGHVTVQANATKTKLVFGKTKYELAGLDPDLFTPYTNENDATTSVVLLAPELHRLLRRTTYATAKGPARPILTGVHLALAASVLQATATDGLRLAGFTVPYQTITGEQRSLTVPAALLDKVALGLPAHDDDEKITLVFGSSSLIVSWDDDSYRTVIRALDGHYPDTSRIIPQNAPYRIELDRQELLDACERVSILSETEHQRAQFEFSREGLILTAISSQYGNARDTVEVKSVSTDRAFTLVCNIHYWITLLRSFEGIEQIEVGLVDANQPFTVKPVGVTGLCLIAPMANTQAVSKETASSESTDERVSA